MVKGSYMGSWKKPVPNLRFSDIQLLSKPPQEFLRDIQAARSGSSSAIIRVKRFLLEKRIEACSASIVGLKKSFRVYQPRANEMEARQAVLDLFERLSPPSANLNKRQDPAKPGLAYLSFIMDVLRDWGRADLLAQRQPANPLWASILKHLCRIGESFNTHLASYYQIELLLPQRGDIFDPAKHAAMNGTGNEGLFVIDQTEQIGFKRVENSEVLEKAIVMVHQR